MHRNLLIASNCSLLFSIHHNFFVAAQSLSFPCLINVFFRTISSLVVKLHFAKFFSFLFRFGLKIRINVQTLPPIKMQLRCTHPTTGFFSHVVRHAHCFRHWNASLHGKDRCSLHHVFLQNFAPSLAQDRIQFAQLVHGTLHVAFKHGFHQTLVGQFERFAASTSHGRNDLTTQRTVRVCC